MSFLLAAAGPATAPQPAPAKIVWNNTVNLHVDGNSIYAPWGSKGMDQVIFEETPTIGTSGATRTNTAIAGQSWQDMIDNPADTDNAWVEGKTNVLLLSETHNTIASKNKTATENIQLARQYIAARRAKHPWIILLVGTIPAGGNPDTLTPGGVITWGTANSRFTETDAYMAANYQDMGVHGYVDLRSIPMYNHDGSTIAAFTAYAANWTETAAPYVHPNNGGKIPMAQKIGAALLDLPATA